MSAAELLSRLEGLKPCGSNRWRARCPAHGSKSQTLAIRIGSNGRPLLHCHAGCDARRILNAVGLTWRGLLGEPDYLPPMDRGESERFAAIVRNAQAQAKAEREEAQSAAAHRARDQWGQAGEANPGHPYLIAKGVEPYGLRQAGALLLVPLTDITGTVWNLQTIAPDGTKRFQKGGRVTGLSCLIGDPGDDPARVLACEGFATGATLHSETGAPVYCAMHAGNLKPVALAVRSRYPDADIVICGDDDRHTEGNPGRTAATAAAEAIGGRVCFPTFGPGERGSDFNDLANLRRRAVA